MIGKADNTNLDSITFTGDVIAEVHVGGLIGHAVDTTVDQVEIDSRTFGGSSVGGLIGKAKDSNSISNVSVQGEVIVRISGLGLSIGGFVGSASSDTTIANSYGTVQIVNTNGYDWYGAGPLFSDVSITDSYYLSGATHKTRDEDSLRTEDELKNGKPTAADVENPIFVGLILEIVVLSAKPIKPPTLFFPFISTLLKVKFLTVPPLT